MKHLLEKVAMTAVLTGGFLAPAYAGTITFREVEFKGTFEIQQPVTFVVPTETVVLNCNTLIIIGPGNTRECNPVQSIEILPNTETFTASVPVTIDLYNIYVAEIEIPQPTTLDTFIDIFWFSAGDTGSGIGSLPSGMSLDEGFLTGRNTKIQYPLEITTITNLSNLPTSSANNTNIVWDISSISDPTGEFFLAKATLPFGDVCDCKIPEPGSNLGFAVLGVVGIASTLKRKLKPFKSAEKELEKVR